jgi:hypothetical protein
MKMGILMSELHGDPQYAYLITERGVAWSLAFYFLDFLLFRRYHRFGHFALVALGYRYQ